MHCFLGRSPHLSGNKCHLKKSLLKKSRLYLRPETLYPLVHHPCPEVHSPALTLIRLILERRSNVAIRAGFAVEEGDAGYDQLAALLQTLTASPQLVSAVLSLVHQRPMDVGHRFEFSR